MPLKTTDGWIGVDLDRTLAEYDVWRGATHIGKPIPAMRKRVLKWLADGRDVRIFTARVSSDCSSEMELQVLEATVAIRAWCCIHLGRPLPITCQKDFDMVELWDDRAVQVIANTGLSLREYSEFNQVTRYENESANVSTPPAH